MYIYTQTMCTPTHVDPRARLLSRMRKTIFGIQAASCTRGETLERRNYTPVWACVRTGTRTRPAFDCILRIYSGRRVYARRARFASFPLFFFFFFFFFPLALYSFLSIFAFPFSRTRRTASACAREPKFRHDLLTFIDSLTPNDTRSGIYATSIFGADRRNPDERGASENVRKSGRSRGPNVDRAERVYVVGDLRNKICIAMKPAECTAAPSSFIQHYGGSHCDDVSPYLTLIQ